MPVNQHTWTRHVTSLQVTLDNEALKTTKYAKYRRMHLDKRFMWKQPLTMEKTEVYLRMKKLN